MKTKNIFKNKTTLILGMLFCFVLVAIATMYEITAIDQYSGRIRVSYQIFLFVTVYSYENDTEFSKRVAKYVVHPPKWKADRCLPMLSTRPGVSAHCSYHGAINDTRMITLICSLFDTSLEDQEALYQFALKTLGNYEEYKFYFSRISNYSEEHGGLEIRWKEVIEEMENEQM